VSAVDNVAVVLFVERSLSAELTAKELGRVGGRATEGASDVGHVGDDGLDTVALALDLGLEERHAVSVELVIDIATNVDHGHDGEGSKSRRCSVEMRSEKECWRRCIKYNYDAKPNKAVSVYGQKAN